MKFILLKLGVSFNKKKVFNYLEKIYFSINTFKKDFYLFQLLLMKVKKDLLIFNNNIFFNEWNDDKKISS